MGTASPPARDDALRARLGAPASGSPLDRVDAVTDLDVLALSAPIGVFRCTAADGIVWVNRRFVEILGWSEEEALGRDWLPSVHPLDRRRIDDARIAFFASPEDLVLALRIVRTDGVVRHVRMRVLPGAAQPQEPPVFVGAVEDVTEEVGALHVPADGPAEDPFRTLVVVLATGGVPLRRRRSRRIT